MNDLDVIDERSTALAMLDPLRARVLAQLGEPGSATTVASALGEPRQKVNYHMRTLEDHGLIGLVEERPRRGLTERVMLASARSYVLSPAVLGDNAAQTSRTDRMSANYLIALAARLIREVAGLTRAADASGRTLPTMAIDTDIRFASAADRAAFTVELTDAITSLASRYHAEATPGGRWHRLVVGAHPRPRHADVDPTTEES